MSRVQLHLFISFFFIFIFFQSVITITLDVEVTTQNDDFAQAKSSLEGNVTKAKAAPSMYSIKVSQTQNMSLKRVNDTPTIGVCVDGSVYGLNQDVGHSQKCRKSSNACCKNHFKVPRCDYVALQKHTTYATLSSDVPWITLRVTYISSSVYTRAFIQVGLTRK